LTYSFAGPQRVPWVNWVLHLGTITPCPTLKSPGSATAICFDPAVAIAVVWNFDPEAPQSAASRLFGTVCAKTTAGMSRTAL
jgi:hypothetical protein